MDAAKVLFIKIGLAAALLAALFFVWQWRASLQVDQPIDRGSSNGNYQPDAIVATHTYQDGRHRLAGTVSLPTPCYQMSLDTRIMESMPEQVVLDFSLAPPPPDLTCIQVIDERDFATEFQASPNPVIKARVNGQDVMIVIDDKAGTLKQQTVP